MQKNNNVPESIWAAGVPEKVDQNDVLTMDLLVSMAVDYLMKNVVIPTGFKVEEGFPRKELPNIVMKRDGEVYAVIVIPSVFPKYTVINDELRLKFVNLCKEKDVKPLMATVGYMSIDDDRAKAGLALKGDVFKTTFPGFFILTDEEKQDMSIKPEKLFRP